MDLDLKLRQLHLGLPASMTSCLSQTEDESLRTIIAVAGLYSGDFATGLGLRTMLVGLGALIEERDERGMVTGYRKGEFPEPEDPLSWVDRENAKLRKAHEEELARNRREHELREAAQRTLNASAIEAERAAFDARLNEHADTLKAIVREAVREELAEQSAASV